MIQYVFITTCICMRDSIMYEQHKRISSDFSLKLRTENAGLQITAKIKKRQEVAFSIR